jgi:hypothetical protein
MARGGRIINKAKRLHPVGRLKSPITKLMGTGFQSQHVADLSNQQTLHGASKNAGSNPRIIGARKPRMGK